MISVLTEQPELAVSDTQTKIQTNFFKTLDLNSKKKKKTLRRFTQRHKDASDIYKAGSVYTNYEKHCSR